MLNLPFKYISQLSGVKPPKSEKKILQELCI